MVQPLDENWGSSKSHGHTAWLMCEVALNVCGEGGGCYLVGFFMFSNFYKVQLHNETCNVLVVHLQ